MVSNIVFVRPPLGLGVPTRAQYSVSPLGAHGVARASLTSIDHLLYAEESSSTAAPAFSESPSLVVGTQVYVYKMQGSERGWGHTGGRRGLRGVP